MVQPVARAGRGPGRPLTRAHRRRSPRVRGSIPRRVGPSDMPDCPSHRDGRVLGRAESFAITCPEGRGIGPPGRVDLVHVAGDPRVG
ncbi:MAG: hypothetical protein ACK55I_45420, partial [bacterium]